MRFISPLAAVLALAACGAAPPATTASPQSSSVDPAALYCQGSGGQVISRVAGGRRADLCKLPGGKTVRTADLLNSHNDL